MTETNLDLRPDGREVCAQHANIYGHKTEHVISTDTGCQDTHGIGSMIEYRVSQEVALGGCMIGI